MNTSLMYQLNSIYRNRTAELTAAGLLHTEVTSDRKIPRALYADFDKLGLHAHALDVPNIVLSNKGTLRADHWIPALVDGAWSLLTSISEGTMAEEVRTYRRNKHIPLHDVLRVYAAAGTPITFTVLPLDVS